MLSVEDLKRQIKDVDNRILALQKEKDGLLLRYCENKNAQFVIVIQDLIDKIRFMNGVESICIYLQGYIYNLEGFTHEVSNKEFNEVSKITKQTKFI